MVLNETFTSTGAKFFAHEEAMAKLRNGKGQPIVSHVMLTDVCNHTCAFCSVQARAGDSLPYYDVLTYLNTLRGYGLKAVILSGGGNPILYKCKETGKNFNDIVEAIHEQGLEIGLITNGMPMREFHVSGIHEGEMGPEFIDTFRESWGTVKPATLDKLTWVRISMSGLDHQEREVYVPDINFDRTTLGFSYVAHDLYIEHADKHHGKVSRQLDLISGDCQRKPDLSFEARIEELTDRIAHYVKVYRPRYVRLLPNCLEPELIPQRCEQLRAMANSIDPNVVFVQYKPPAAPKACYLGYVHPVLNCDGYVYPCDSCVLNEAAGHTFANPWRVCHWSDIGRIYDEPVRSLIKEPARTCPGCVFTKSNEILGTVVDGTADLTPPTSVPEHVNFV